MIDKEQIKDLSVLARIKMSEDEISSFTNNFEEIIAFVSKLQELNTENIDESVLNTIYPKNIFRVDKKPHKEGIYTKKILADAPNTKDGYIQVDKILNQD